MNAPSESPRHDLLDRTFEFARRIVLFCRYMNKTPGISRALTNQLLRAGTSIGANVQEGYVGTSRADFIARYTIALKESRETLYWLRLIASTNDIPPERLESLIDEANQLVAILTTIVKRTRKNMAAKGSKK